MPIAAFRFCLFLAACAATAMAAPKALDQSRIHAFYHDGEFDKVIQALEAFSKSGKTCSSGDSVFLEKHLAVVYAANPGTRELGRYHMFRMLDIAPGADLLDMFVGEEVDGVFDKVRKEHALRLAAKRGAKSETVQSRPASMTASWDALPESAPAPSKPAEAAKASAASMGTPAVKGTAPQKRSAAAPVSASPAVTAPRASASHPAVQAKSTVSIKPPVSSRPWWDVGPDAAGKLTAASALSATSKPASADEVSSKLRSPSPPAWKEPGLWIGGGAALAVVTLALFYSGSADAPAAKTYVVPSVPAH
jgi:hypothetical protein